MAVGTVVISSSVVSWNKVNRCLLVIDATAGTAAETGLFPDLAIDPTDYGIMGWYLYSIQTNPDGVTAPQDQYDVTLEDAEGSDILATQCLNRSSTVTQKVFLSSIGFSIVDGALTLKIGGNNVAAAKTKIKLMFVPEK